MATYSGGMRRRLDLAMTLMGRPRIVFLDEPTTGLDPRSRRTVWRIVRDLVDDGVTIFLTTHYLEEADELADRIAVLHHGRIIAEGTPDELKRLVPGGTRPAAHRGRRRSGGGVGALPGGVPDHDALTLDSPGTAGRHRRIRLTSSGLPMNSRCTERKAAATPDTCGAAIEVPESST